MKRILRMLTFAGAFLITTLLVTSCSTFSDYGNNSSTLTDIVDHFQKSGIKIEKTVPLMTKTLGAQDAMVIVIAGRDVGIYKFNIKLKKQRQRIEFAKKHKYVFLIGRKYEAIVNGSFVMVAANSNKEKTKIIKAFKSFKP